MVRPATGRLVRHLPWLLAPWGWFVVRDLHPRIDVIALAMPVVVGAAIATCLLVALFRVRWAPVVTSVSWALFGVATIFGPWIPHDQGTPVRGVRIVAANVLGERPDPRSIAADIEAESPAVLVVSEVGKGSDKILRQGFDHVVRSEAAGQYGTRDVALYTDLPVIDLGLPGRLSAMRGVRVRIDAPDGPFVVYGMHLPPPRLVPSESPEITVQRHTRLVRKLRSAIADEALPVVLAGDLNLVDRASGYRDLTDEVDDALRSTWLRPTSLKTSGRVLLARIDHVFMPEGWCSDDATVFELTGSDHRGVAATVGRCR